MYESRWMRLLVLLLVMSGLCFVVAAFIDYGLVGALVVAGTAFGIGAMIAVFLMIDGY
jgi:hypothetical protein